MAEWWDSQNWGSVPDWFAAIGTVGALFLGLIILIDDRRRGRRSDADSFVTWRVVELSSHSEWGPRYQMMVHAHNAGTKPIPVASVQSPEFEPGYTLEFMRDGSHGQVIAPGQTVVKKIDYKDKPPVWEHLVVRFSDGQGRMWRRVLSSDKYLSQRKYDRLMKDSLRKKLMRKLSKTRDK